MDRNLNYYNCRQYLILEGTFSIEKQSPPPTHTFISKINNGKKKYSLIRRDSNRCKKCVTVEEWQLKKKSGLAQA